MTTARKPGVCPAKIGKWRQQNIEGWFGKIASYVAKRPDFLEALSNITRIFNADESMLRFLPSAPKVLSPIGTCMGSQKTRSSVSQSWQRFLQTEKL